MRSRAKADSDPKADDSRADDEAERPRQIGRDQGTIPWWLSGLSGLGEPSNLVYLGSAIGLWGMPCLCQTCGLERNYTVVDSKRSTRRRWTPGLALGAVGLGIRAGVADQRRPGRAGGLRRRPRALLLEPAPPSRRRATDHSKSSLILICTFLPRSSHGCQPAEGGLGDSAALRSDASAARTAPSTSARAASRTGSETTTLNAPPSFSREHREFIVLPSPS